MTSHNWFIGGVASWFTAWGMNALVFSWLVVGVLEAEARYIGIAQTSTMLPSLLLLLWGGALADRLDPRRVLIVLHLACTVPILALSSLIGSGGLTLGILLLYGATLGTLQAFVMPARKFLMRPWFLLTEGRNVPYRTAQGENPGPKEARPSPVEAGVR